MLLWPLGIVIAIGGAIFVAGLRLSPQTADLLSTAVLGSTLAAAVWYSVETRMLRQQQQRESEIRHHPWLKGSDLIVDWYGRWPARPMGCESIHLPVTNVGTTPAHGLEIIVKWRLAGQNPSAGENKIGGIDLAPGDTWHAKLCEIDFKVSDDQAIIDVEIAYRSFLGGGGRFRMNFYSHRKGWANGPMSPYEFWLADGRTFPVRGAALPGSN